ncbi:ricin-type beta-trefoil lectin domain protein [Streptomyces huiliensis]|uniref:ricin-type beta-trefoil lectin domain protein n=1 Tax=Streptomyces huiliensis TaxID=2876027 RepID=UPI001CBBA780|nr:ricin-type beta-trefoil lectin domain protein [Streptomyces huiliensis]MBZ4323225.1 ricin-type beta-trefoil lectin domain protein [Streptomyces huiliensis]
MMRTPLLRRPRAGSRAISRAGSRPGTPRPRLTAALSSALLAAGLLVGTGAGTSGQPARADGGTAASQTPGSGRPFATYNMQGSDHGLRWTGEVGPLTMRHEVVALQEVGNGPPAEPSQARGTGVSIPITHPFPAGLPGAVNHTQWEYRHHRRHVYFLQTDPQRHRGTGQDRWTGGRVNLAVVTHARADEVRVIENPLYDRNEPRNEYRYRRALGVRFGNTVYYNVHARGADVGPLLRGIRAAARAGESWVMVGDFNLNIRNRSDRQARERTLRLRADERLARSRRATHQRGGELDYAITHGTPAFNAGVPAARGSDHYPVQFEPAPTPVPAAPDGRAHVFSTGLENASTGAALDVTDRPGSRVTTRRQAYNANQRFRVGTVQGHWYRFARGGSPQAAPGTLTKNAAGPELCPGVNPLLPLSVLAWSCDAPEAQWTPDDPGEPGGPLRWRNSRRPELCLTGGRSGDAVGALPCNDSAAQQWWDNSRAVPEKEWRVGDGRTRLRAFNGLYLDLRGGTGRDGTPLTARKKNGAGSQRWDTEYAEFGDNLVRLRALGGGKRCVDLVNADRPRPGDRTVLGNCSDRRAKKDGTGHRWQAEMYGDGTLRFRNEGAHLCLAAPLRETGYVTIESCDDSPRQRWTIVP